MDEIARLELLAQRDVGRGIGPLAAHSRGGLLSAARAIATAAEPRVAFVTGCFVVGSEPPAPETDGPVGAALAASALVELGLPALLVTDERCAAVVRACAPDLRVAVGDDPALLARELAAAGVTHVVFVERLGPGDDGVVRNMRGDDVGAVTAPLHLLAAGPWTTVGVGDGGNEVGMGALPPRLVAAAVPHGERIRCAVACDHLIVAGVSNWGAIALARAVALLRRVRVRISPATHDALLAACVAAGAVDGMLGRPAASVDGVDPALHETTALPCTRSSPRSPAEVVRSSPWPSSRPRATCCAPRTSPTPATRSRSASTTWRARPGSRARTSAASSAAPSASRPTPTC